MVEASNKVSTSKSSVSPTKSQQKTRTVPQRELTKRKSVAFEDDRATSPVTASTSDYIYSQKKEWTFVATCFDMVDESGHDQREREDAELLGLCDWFEEEKKRPVLNDDSDDHIPYEIFAEQGMRIRYQDPTSKSSLSSLRLNSLLRLESRPRISAAAAASQFVQIEEEENTLENQKNSIPSQKEELEKAFQGVLSCSNSQKANKRRSVEKVPEVQKAADEDDFWNQVEF